MRKQLAKYSRGTLVAVVTVFAILSTWLIIFVTSGLVGNKVVASDLILGTLCPLLIAPACTWHLIGLVIKLDSLEKKMREFATYDDLTSALTRRSFISSATEYYSVARRYKKNFGLLMIDIDDFKFINDTYGHYAGDEVLKSFGSVVSDLKRRSDLAGRFGGDEFIFLLPETDLAGTMHFAKDLHAKLFNTQVRVDGATILYTISIGVTIFPQLSTAPDLDQLIQQADAALYAAKTTGKNKTVPYVENKETVSEGRQVAAYA